VIDLAAIPGLVVVTRATRRLEPLGVFDEESLEPRTVRLVHTHKQLAQEKIRREHG